MTMATTVAAVRRILKDDPPRDKLAAAMSDTTTLTFTPTEVSLYSKGQRVEWDDGNTGAEQALVSAVDQATPLITLLHRGMYGSTATTHAIATDVLFGPRYYYDEVAQTINSILEEDLYGEGLYEIDQHSLIATSTTEVFNAPTAECQRFLRVYYRILSTDTPIDIWRFDHDLPNADTSLYSNGKYVRIQDQPLDGTVMFVLCAHKLGIATLTSAQQRILEWLTCARLLEQGEPRRDAGPTNQGDRTVRPNTGIQTAAYYRGLAEEAISKEVMYLQRQYPRRKTYVR
jgi:hypothetical protein